MLAVTAAEATYSLMKLAQVMTDGSTSSDVMPLSAGLRTMVSGGLRPPKPPMGNRLAPVKKDNACRCIDVSKSEMMEMKFVTEIEVELYP